MFANPSCQDALKWTSFATAAHFAATQRDSFQPTLPRKIIARDIYVEKALNMTIPKMMQEMELSFPEALRFKMEINHLTHLNARSRRYPTLDDLWTYSPDELLRYIEKLYGKRIPGNVRDYLHSKRYTGKEFFSTDYQMQKEIMQEMLVVGPDAYDWLEYIRMQAQHGYHSTVQERKLAEESTFFLSKPLHLLETVFIRRFEDALKDDIFS